MNEIMNVSVEDVSNIGGVAGSNTGSIYDTNNTTELKGYSAYFAYTQIEETTTIKDIEINLGGIAGLNAGSVYGMIVGGEVRGDIDNSNVGGIVGKSTGGHIGKNQPTSYLTTVRTLVRGVNAGAVTGTCTESTEFGEFSVEAVDDGERIGFESAMIVKFGDSDELEAVDEEGLSEGQTSYILSGTRNIVPSGVSFKSFLTRTLKDSELAISPNEYYGDYVIYNNDGDETFDGKIKAQYSFTLEQSVIAGLEINTSGGCVEMTAEEGNHPKMFMMFHFGARGYLDNGNFTTVSLGSVQNLLDMNLNTHKPDSVFLPFKTDKNTEIISKNTNILQILNDGTWFVKGTGVCEIVLTNILNETLNETILIYIVPYFNNVYFANPEDDGTPAIMPSIFVNEGVRYATGKSTLKIISRESAVIDINPVYKYESNDLIIKNDGSVMVDNKTIYLKPSQSFTAQVEKVEEKEGDNEFDEHAQALISSDSIRISKLSNAQTNAETVDKIKLKASIDYTYNGVDYTFELPEKAYPNLEVNYYEGVSQVKSTTEYYSLSTATVQQDKITIVSDDSDEKLHYEIYKNNNLIQKNSWSSSVESVASYDFEGNQLEDADKFLNITIINNTELVSDVKISVNKSSSLYKNRFENDIYGEYEVVFFGSSNQAICKRITLNLDDTQIESVVFANYPNKDELSMQTEKVIPGNEGVVTIAFSPADAEFYSIKVSNDSRNFAEGASYAGFIFGKVVNGEFEAFKSGMSFSSDGSVSITKKDLMANISNYQGEFAVRYRFFNTAKVTDGASVALNFVIVDFNQNILKEESVELTIDKEFFFDVTVDGKAYDDEVGYTLARGVTYDLTVENWGYDEDSVEISTSDSLLGVVEKTETGHKLHLTAFESEDQSFTIDMKATRTDAEGKEQTIEKSRKICIMDFVINYNKTAQNLNPDIVKGMDNGVIEVALNSEFELEIDFDNFSMLEYDAANRAVVNRVEEFLKTIQTGGVWTLYTSNSKNPPPVSVSDDFTKLNITEFTDTQTDEFTAYKHNIIFKKEHSPDQRRYVFTYNVKIGIEDGKYKIDDSEEIFNFDIEFLIDAYLLGSEEYPNPISSYDVGENSFVNMKAGGNYILTNDIYVTPENFKPINFNSNMLDGNSFTIFFKSGEYVLDTTQAALFLDVQEFSTIKNLKIVFEDASNGVVFKTSNILEPLTFASVAISNSGNLTNIEILGDIQVDLANKSNSDLDLPDGSIVAGLCATNSGNITHSRVFASIKANSSLSGMVGANSGVVSSSYYKEGTLVNKSSQAAAFEVAGLVISNSESGIISSSYTSGEVSSSHIYSYYTNKSKINSTMETAGFIYQNDGEIYDCYSNIPLDVPGKGSSGFVYKNYGLIQNSFTTSISLQKENTSSYSFAFSNTSSEGGGTFENCYSLEDPDYSYSAGDTVSGINTSLKKNNFEGVSVLNVADFANLDNFSTYAHGKTSQNYNNVWMFVQKDQFVSEDIFRRTLIQKTNNKYSGQEFESQTFISGRLELVSSNIIATSFKELQDDFELDENGNTQYIYNQFIYEGSQNNPYLINTAQKFDEYMGQSSRVYSHFRIINDLDYNELSSNISTHKTEFKGMLEGNRMTLSNAIIFGSESLTSAGLIGSIMGTDLNSKVAVQNLTIIPKRVSFANASIVGTLAGQTKWANIANIQILSNANDDEEGQSSMVVVGGKNIVGGVIGLADANTKIKNIESSISARAYFLQSKLTETQEGIFDGNVKNIEEKSYAGTVVGYAYSTRTSNTTIENIKVLGSNISVTGGKIGFVFGGISQKVIVNHVEISILDGMELHSTVYAGLILGESAGVLSNITINGSATLLETFSTEKYIPTAVGGVCGWMIEGKLEKVYMGQSFDIVQRKNNYTDALLNVSIIGGIAGIAGGQTSSLRKCELNQIVMDGSISAHGIMGGVVGHNQADLELNKVALYKHNLDLSGFQEKSIIGGFVGSSTEKVKITNAYSHLDIQLSAFVYGTRIEASINAIIGEQKAGAVTDLENIYTTTIYDVVLENKSCMGSVKEVKAIPDGANAENCLFGFSDTVFGPEEKDGIKINFNATTTSTNKVYNFFGLIETKDSENENADVLKSGANLYNKVLKTTRFSARTDFGKEIVLNQKEFGRSILSHYNSINNNDEILPTIEMFYGLMSEAGGHWVNKDSNDNKILSYLTFEENVVPVK